MSLRLGSCRLLHGYLNDEYRTRRLNVENSMKKEHLESLLNHLLLHLGSLHLYHWMLEIQMPEVRQNHCHCYVIPNDRQMKEDCLVLVEQTMECSLAAMLGLFRPQKEYL